MAGVRFLTVGGAALNQTPLDWAGNRAHILAAIDAARQAGVQVLCLPELCISGYGCEDAFHGEAVAEMALASLKQIVPHTTGLAVALGLPLIHGQHLYNAVALCADGRLAGFAAKRVLPGYGVHYEPRWFQPWPTGHADTVTVEGEALPVGDLVFDLGGVRVGFEICEDAWNRANIAASQARGQADVLLNPSASHFAFAKAHTVRNIVMEGSRLSAAVYVYANHLGNEAGRIIYDGSIYIASNGAMRAENQRFSFQPVNLVTAVVDLRANRLERRRQNQPVGGQESAPRTAVRTGFTPVEATQAAPPTLGKEAPAPRVMPQNIEFAHAVALGLWDYLRKSRSHGFAVSLSGGVDSASVAVLCGVMVRLALAELGPQAFREALAHVPDAPGDDATARDWVRRLLLTVYQGSENSSDTTRNAARGVAEAVGARHVALDVGPLVQAYEALAEGVLGRELTWEADDIARQNIQARVRSPGIWLLANLENRLLLSTSNRSEVGVGYATMDGDTSGGLAPIAGANKSFLRAWLKWMESEGLPDIGPLPALAAVNSQAPTAELRPAAQTQADETDLMPYPLLDAIEQAAIRDRMSPLEVWQTLLTRPLPGVERTPAALAADVTTFFRLWSRSQWKRERLAPSFHLDDENLDPRTWCRFPILQGGFEAELAELQAHVAAPARPDEA